MPAAPPSTGGDVASVARHDEQGVVSGSTQAGIASFGASINVDHRSSFKQGLRLRCQHDLDHTRWWWFRSQTPELNFFEAAPPTESLYTQRKSRCLSVRGRIVVAMIHPWLVKRRNASAVSSYTDDGTR
jgi:hypothetical protein